MDKEKKIKNLLEGKKSNPEDDSLQDISFIVQKTAGLKTPERRSTEEAWAGFMEKIENTPDENLPLKNTSTKVINIQAYTAFGVAASVVLLITAYLLFFNTKTISTSAGETLAYELPDGSNIYLNANTTLEFPRINLSDKRNFQLKGEAYFQVLPGNPFTVETEKGQIVVVGTSFNVYARQQLVVSCAEGKVKVSIRDQEVILTAGQAVTTTENEYLHPQDIAEDRIGSWQKGDFFYNNTPLVTVLEEIERQFDVVIHYENAEDRFYSGYFSNQNLESALALVLNPMQLGYEQKGKDIYIRF